MPAFAQLQEGRQKDMSIRNFADTLKLESADAIPDRRIPPAKWKIFAEMNVGDSFFIPEELVSQTSFGSKVNFWNKKLRPRRFVSRKYSKEGERFTKNDRLGFRIFRVK
jgi:hypothetical protein